MPRQQQRRIERTFYGREPRILLLTILVAVDDDRYVAVGECSGEHIEPLSSCLRIGINEDGTSIPVVGELLVDVPHDIPPSNIP